MTMKELAWSIQESSVKKNQSLLSVFHIVLQSFYLRLVIRIDNSLNRQELNVRRYHLFLPLGHYQQTRNQNFIF